VPGYVVGRCLRVGASSEVWSAVCEASRDAVILKRLRLDVGSGFPDELRREATLLASFRHPNVLPLRGVRAEAEGLVLVLDRAETDLADVLLTRGALRPGETVGVVSAIAGAVAAAHDRGIVHGDISPGNVLLRADGTPLLADLGTARLIQVPAGSGATRDDTGLRGTPGFVDPSLCEVADLSAGSDVYGLAALCACLLVGAPLTAESDAVQRWACRAHELGLSPTLVATVCATLVVPAPQRPGAAEFAAQLRQSCGPEPLLPVVTSSGGVTDAGDRAALAVTRVARGSGQAHRRIQQSKGGWLRRWNDARSMRARMRRRGRHFGVRRRRGLRPLRTVGLVALIPALLGMGVIGWASLASGESHTPAAPARVATSQPTPYGAWQVVLEQLDTARGRAFARLDPGLLDKVYAPHSPMRPADRAQILRLQLQNNAVIGLRHEFRIVSATTGPGSATLRVRERLGQYAVATLNSDSSDEPVHAVPRSLERDVRFSLLKVEGAWRIDAVSPG
jgi:hypothetical protein